MPYPRISLTVRTLTVFTRYPGPLKPCEVARALNHQVNAVRVILGRLCDRGELIHLDGGRYQLPSPTEIHIWDLFR